MCTITIAIFQDGLVPVSTELAVTAIERAHHGRTFRCGSVERPPDDPDPVGRRRSAEYATRLARYLSAEFTEDGHLEDIAQFALTAVRW